MSELLQIVPRFPPQFSGVGDYAIILGREMARSHGQPSAFLVGDPAWKPAGVRTEFEVNFTARRHASDLQERCVGARNVFLHYVGYGYSKRGVPIWLLKAMSKSVKLGRVNLLIFFHELYAFGPPWRSSFWLSPLQRWVCSRLARLSSVWFTNREASAEVLRAMAPRHAGQVGVLPVISNLGEPASNRPVNERPPQLLVYGRIARTHPLSSEAVQGLKTCCARLGIKRLISFGPSPPVGFDFLPLQHLGVLPVEEASLLLSQSRAGYVDYDARFLGKSGIFAAYCAHGLVPVLPCSSVPCGDGLVATVHFLGTENIPEGLDPVSAERIALAAQKWYSQHNLEVTARTVAFAVKELERQ